MEVKVNVEASHVNEVIAKAVVESQLGVALKDRIEKFLNEEKHYGGPSFSKAMEQAVDSELQTIVMKMINTEYAEKIRAAVREKLTEDVITALVTKAFEKLNQRY